MNSRSGTHIYQDLKNVAKNKRAFPRVFMFRAEMFTELMR